MFSNPFLSVLLSGLMFGLHPSTNHFYDKNLICIHLSAFLSHRIRLMGKILTYSLHGIKIANKDNPEYNFDSGQFDKRNNMFNKTIFGLDNVQDDGENIPVFTLGDDELKFDDKYNAVLPVLALKIRYFFRVWSFRSQ